MTIRTAEAQDIDAIAPLIAGFRVALKGYKGIAARENLPAAKEEFLEYIQAGFPIYLCFEGERCAGYLVCRVDAPVVWVESIYVAPEHRRGGIASALFAKAENLAASYGEDTLYNYVHPSNDAMLGFLRKRGYSVLNLIEIRKKHEGEVTREKVRVMNNEFDY